MWNDSLERFRWKLANLGTLLSKYSVLKSSFLGFATGFMTPKPGSRKALEGCAKLWVPGLVPAVAYHFCLQLPENVSKSGDHFFVRTFISIVIYYRIAKRLGLKSKSFGKEGDRFITVSRKFDAAHIIEELIRRGGSNEKYILVPPNSATMT